MLRSWPDLSHYFGIRPWEVARLSAAEINQYIDALIELHEEQQRQEQQARSARRG